MNEQGMPLGRQREAVFSTVARSQGDKSQIGIGKGFVLRHQSDCALPEKHLEIEHCGAFSRIVRHRAEVGKFLRVHVDSTSAVRIDTISPRGEEIRHIAPSATASPKYIVLGGPEEEYRR
ncbi:hypothetical protein [Lentzea kentuckyensis]|uniref:hypothetical protein n=1 Tax=Lentzea kentuckyensis TaxID=360086 RepID=UPI001302172C|nr:hypothetical protein [Lentzea kentuckyensis]